MVDLLLLEKLSIALLIGLVVGLEREIAQESRQNVKFAGLRTFGIVGLIGGVSAYLSDQGFMLTVAVALLAITMLTVVAYYRASEISKHLGYTTEMALLATFLLGAAAYYDYTLAIIFAIILTVILAFKDPLHEFTYGLPKEEFYDSLKFAIIAIVILPILYDQFNHGYGPLEAFNPYQLWLIVVIVSAISFIGYFLVKWFGADLGLALTGVVGGLASSTAVTTAMATRTKESKGIEYPAATSSTLANTVMFLRVLFLVAIFYPALVMHVILPLGAMFVSGVLVASYFYIRGRGDHKADPIKLSTPFSIGPALAFGVFVAVIMFVSKAALVYLGNYGLYLTSMFAGLADTNAITVSVSQLAASGTASISTAVIAIMLAVFVNVAVHSVYAFYFGTRKFGLYTAIMATVVIVVGAVVMLLTL
ncbi:MAG TPA: MgtC/SapB family protein [Methanocella sp.]|uniref:MgtC/SapB family protein n=1 Tax=Methanocella sp. TaxID=2052833 RepID=UPI002BDDF107|nr:MgtC/SapB family protein [Methanocella sp.]HTY90393.1 MgtC/SapB family protein [Methanocella sp.]